MTERPRQPLPTFLGIEAINVRGRVLSISKYYFDLPPYIAKTAKALAQAMQDAGLGRYMMYSRLPENRISVLKDKRMLSTLEVGVQEIVAKAGDPTHPKYQTTLEVAMQEFVRTQVDLKRLGGK